MIHIKRKNLIYMIIQAFSMCNNFFPLGMGGIRLVSARNCSQTTKEQANTISKVKLNKIGFRVLVFSFG